MMIFFFIGKGKTQHSACAELSRSIVMVRFYFELERKKGRFITVKLIGNWYKP